MLNDPEHAKTVFQSILNAAPIGMLLVNKHGEIIFANKKIEETFGYEHGELISESIKVLLPEKVHKEHQSYVSSYMKTPSAIAMHDGRIVSGYKKDRQPITLQIGLTCISLDNENHVLASILETTNTTLKASNLHDPLTSLPDRNLFLELSENLLNLSRRNQSMLTIMFIDLDNFKQVNDQNGHHIGDLLLIKVSKILCDSLRKNDIVGRIGGDEFIVCLQDIEKREHIEHVANKMLEGISDIKHIENHKINISASIGAIHTAPSANTSVSELYDVADKLMYHSKNTGKGKLTYKLLENNKFNTNKEKLKSFGSLKVGTC